MTISLITACYNSAAVIRTAIESVLRQTWLDVEYLVVDGGSTDGTTDILREMEPHFRGRLRWVSERDSGMYDAINKGIRMATGDVVGILNADDALSTDGVLARVAAAFESPTGADNAPDAIFGTCDSSPIAAASLSTPFGVSRPYATTPPAPGGLGCCSGVSCHHTPPSISDASASTDWGCTPATT